MGSNSSKPSEVPKPQVWTSESPVRFSQPLVDGLQDSSENGRTALHEERQSIGSWNLMLTPNIQSDSTRSKSLELHIQSRVNAELQRLHAQAEKDFETLASKISEKTTSEKSSSSPSDGGDKSAKAAGDQLRDLGRESVQNEVQQLKKKLEQRKRVQEVDEGVERAKSEVVRCLRDNDRRPLDCWKEVEAFKREVGRLEGVWVDKVVR